VDHEDYDNGVKVTYSAAQWRRLKLLRRRAIATLTVLASAQLHAQVHGSVARGDVTPSSDIDIIIPYSVSSFTVEQTFTKHGVEICSRKLVQATPNHTLKAHVYLDARERHCVTFPLTPLRSLELDFYQFGGVLTLPELQAAKRVPGCTKKLLLIQPIAHGHLEFPIRERMIETAKILRVNLELVRERVRVLTRRRDIGRTGVVLSVNLEDGEVFEDVLRELAASNPIVRRHLRTRR
jgi:predicted nucleotidyltransferase